MKIVFIIKDMKFSGGTKLMFDYANYLMSKNYDVTVLVREEEGELKDYIKVRIIPAFSSKYIPKCDILIATTLKETSSADKSKQAKHVVNFCQNYPLVKLNARISGKLIPMRYKGNGLLKKFRLIKKKRAWKKKLKKYDEIFKLNNNLIAITKPMQVYLEKRYKRTVYLCRNGVDLNNLHPKENWLPKPFTKSNPMKIINIGLFEIDFKDIPTTIKAFQAAKIKITNIKLTRITANADKESNNSLYRLYINPPRKDLCSLLRNSDIYISNSTESEGFGLPAMEALASGLICIFSDITAYKSFSKNSNFCIFVPEGDIKATASAIEKIYNMPAEEITQLRNNGIEVSKKYSHESACKTFEKILLNIYNT